MKNIVLALGIPALFVLVASNNVGKKAYKVKKVVIDAGHGGRDVGALGRSSREKDITLRIALELGELIEQHMQGVKVIYTRKKDEFVTLHRRAQIANKNNVDAFISIHCNAISQGETAYGTETYTMGVSRSAHNLRVAKKENSVILMEEDRQQNYEDFDPESPEGHILMALNQSANNDNSLRLAQNIEDQFKNRVGRKSRGVKQASLWVLWKTIAPSVLVEVGFISDAKEEKYLKHKGGQRHIAMGIFRAFLDYKKQLEASN